MNGDKISVPELSLAELQVLMRQVQDVYRDALQAEQDRAQARVANIEGAVTRLDTLLGPEDANPYDPSGNAPATIRSVGAHAQATLAQNSGLALDLILAGMEELALTVRDMATVLVEVKRRTDQNY